MLTQGSTVIVLMVALLLVAFVVGLIWWAVAVRRRRASVHRAGPESRRPAGDVAVAPIRMRARRARMPVTSGRSRGGV